MNFIQKTTAFCNEIMKDIGEEFSEKHFQNIMNCIKEEAKETHDAFEALTGNIHPGADLAKLEELLDGYMDTAFTAIAGAYVFLRKLGHTHEDATAIVAQSYERVTDANLTKKNPDGTVTRDDSGKVQKPADFVAPSYSDIILPEKAANDTNPERNPGA